jgi:hypothetical protein
MTRDAPELRIVSDLWAAARDRMTRAGDAGDDAGPRAIVRRDIGSKYLSGFARCATCGWSMTVITRQHGKTRRPFLGCLSHYKRGPHVCANGQLVPMEMADRAVLGALEGDALDPRIVATIIDMVFEQLKPANADANVAALKRQLRVVDDKIENLTAAVENGEALAPLVTLLRDRQQERERLIEAIGAAGAIEQIHLDRKGIEERVGAGGELARIAHGVIEDGGLCCAVLSGPLVFTRERGYHFKAPVATGELIAGAVVKMPTGGVPRGCDSVGEGAQKLASPRGRALSHSRIGRAGAGGLAGWGIEVLSSGGPPCGVVTREIVPQSAVAATRQFDQPASPGPSTHCSPSC